MPLCEKRERTRVTLNEQEQIHGRLVRQHLPALPPDDCLRPDTEDELELALGQIEALAQTPNTGGSYLPLGLLQPIGRRPALLRELPHRHPLGATAVAPIER